MSIVIYTYSDPYRLKEEPYWDEIKACPYFCAAQTLVNGLKYLYREDFVQGRVTTVRNFVEALFPYWQSTACRIKQHAAIDRWIAECALPAAGAEEQEQMRAALLANRGEVLESIRTMVELGIDAAELREEALTPAQKIVVELFRLLSTERGQSFAFSSDVDEAEMDEALLRTMQEAAHQTLDCSRIALDRIVIHGVHQFTPIMLRAIEAAAKHKKVILLFNYQQQYQNIYQTWIDIYTSFDCPMTNFGGEEFRPIGQDPISRESNLLADKIGRLVEGDTSSSVQTAPFEILEFDNMTEFAGYVADVFESAARVNPANPMAMMREQIYAADSSANEILKIYFPEQFGERQFLHYPLGRFFVAIANMWDIASNKMVVRDARDVRECLDAGILKEEHAGQLSTIWGRMAALFEGCASIEEMLSRLRRLRKNKRYMTDAKKKEYVSHLAYYNVAPDEIDRLGKALAELTELATYFYEDFERQPHNFSSFYKKLKAYLQQDVLDAHVLDEEFNDILRRVLVRLDEVEDIEESASFACLKATMSIYLVQEANPAQSAQWIVRNFEQIDGDILRSLNDKTNGEPTIYHFACLTDEDLAAAGRAKFPWPLTDSFFEAAQDPVDWKHQVYVKARSEYKNYKRYALLYGLAFNRAGFKLSYVRRAGDKEREPYYLLKILGAKKRTFEDSRRHAWVEDVSAIQTTGVPLKKYDKYDYFRYRICKYKFLLESIIESTTVYKEPFLLLKYFEVILENQAMEKLAGLVRSETALVECLHDTFEELRPYFPFVSNMNRMDIMRKVKGRMSGGKEAKVFPQITAKMRQYMMIRELFIHKKLTDGKNSQNDILRGKFDEVSDDKIAESLNEAALQKKFWKSPHLWCRYCANQEICTAHTEGWRSEGIAYAAGKDVCEMPRRSRE